MEQPTLIKRQESYKLIVTENLERKIRHLCTLSPNNEYSGTLFYDTEGSFENKDLVIICRDFHLQNVGSAAYTEFKNDASLAGFMVDNDLLRCKQGLMH